MSVLKLLLLQIDFAVTFSFVTKLWKRHQSSWISIKTSAFYQVRDFRNFHLMCRHPAKMFDIHTYVHQSYSLLPFLFAEDTAWASRPQFWLYFPRNVAISYRIWAVPTGRGHHSVGNSILVWSWLQGCPLHSCMRNICVISQTLVIFFCVAKTLLFVTATGNMQQSCAHQWGVGERRENSGAATWESNKDGAGMFD